MNSSPEEAVTLAVIATELKHTNRSLDLLTSELRTTREGNERRFSDMENKLALMATKQELRDLKNDQQKWNYKVVGVAVTGLISSLIAAAKMLFSS